MKSGPLYGTLVALWLCGCSAAPALCKRAPAGEVVFVVEQGWHAEVGLPVSELSRDLAFLRRVFPGAKSIMFGYGKKTFFTAPPETWSEYLLGPVPGPAAIHVVALNVLPDEAYAAENTIVLALPKGGAEALSSFIAGDLGRDETGTPRVVARSSAPDGLFYAARSRYTLGHTCNRWAADALHAAGLPVSGQGVAFSGQVMTQVEQTARSHCARGF